MATDTAQVLPPVRQDPRQVTNTLKKIINFGDAGLATGVLFDNSLPKGAVILAVLVEILTAFNAVMTNPIGVGTTPIGTQVVNGAGAGTDLDPTVVGVTSIGRSIGSAIAAAADTPLYANYIPTGGGQTTGQAKITITYEGGWAS